jgi:hypothetical protein
MTGKFGSCIFIDISWLYKSSTGTHIIISTLVHVDNGITELGTHWNTNFIFATGGQTESA